MNYFREAMQNYANFKGRTGRKAFWVVTIICYLLIQLVAFLENLMGFPIMNVPFITMIFSLAMYIPIFSIGARRMHDIGKSGWYYLIPLYNLYLAFQPSEPIANKWGEVPAES